MLFRQMIDMLWGVEYCQLMRDTRCWLRSKFAVSGRQINPLRARIQCTVVLAAYPQVINSGVVVPLALLALAKWLWEKQSLRATEFMNAFSILIAGSIASLRSYGCSCTGLKTIIGPSFPAGHLCDAAKLIFFQLLVIFDLLALPEASLLTLARNIKHW